MNMNSTDRITSGPIARTILALAVPVVLGMFMEIALSVINFFWVGRLGSVAQDAVTTSLVVTWGVFASLTLITIGITALISRHIGAREPDKAAFYVRQGLFMAIGIGSIFSIAGYLLVPSILKFMGAAEETRLLAVPYLRIFFLTTMFFSVTDTAGAIFRASGDTKTPTLVMVGAMALNMILDPLLIFGLGPFPRLGVPGASVATMIAVFSCMVITLYLLFKGKLGYAVGSLWKARPDVAAMLKIARIGLPVTIQQLAFNAVYWFLIKIVHRFGEPAGAAMGIGNRMESISFLTCYGFSLAASTMVGQNLGARNPERAEKCAWGAAGMAIAFTFVSGAIFVAFPQLITGIFTNDPEVHKIAADYLFILGLSQFTMAIEIVLEGSFSGAGDTLPPMLVLLPGAVVRIPLAYYLAFDLNWGINGVWWTLTITTTIKATILALWFKRGKWKTRKL
jgi:putative MATE family efflux protein